MSPPLGRRPLLVGLAAGIGLAATGTPALSAALRAVSHAWVPWNAEPPGSPAVGGIGTRMARRIFDAAGLSVDMTILPWQRCLNDLRTGQSQLGWSVVRNPGRETYLIYSQPLWLSSNLVFARADGPGASWRAWSDMAGMALGVTRGYCYGIELNELRAQGLRVNEIGSEESLFAMLLGKRLDAFIMDWQAYRHLCRKYGPTPPEFVACRLPLPEMAYHIVAARNSTAAVAAMPAIDRAISALRRDGTLAALMRDGMDPTPPPAGTLQSRVAPG